MKVIGGSNYVYDVDDDAHMDSYTFMVMEPFMT
jgi:hypothetical protein